MKNTMNARRPLVVRGKRGSALVLSLMFVLIVAGMGVCMVQLNSSQNRRQEQATDNKRAIYIAEAGLAESFLSVAVGKSGDIASDLIPAAYGGGLFWVEATEVGGGQVALVSTGMIGGGRFSLSAVLQRTMDPLASLGFFSASDMSIGGGAIIDGFDSRNGSFDLQVDPDLLVYSTGIGARMGAQGDIVFGAVARTETIVFGDARPGTDGIVSMGQGVTVVGSTAPKPMNVSLPDVEIPAVDVRLRSLNPDPAGGLDAPPLVSGKYGVEKVTIAMGKSLQVQGPAILVIGELLMEKNSRIAIDTTNGPVSIYITSRIVVPNTAEFVNVGRQSTGFALLLAATEWADFDRDGIADDPIDFRPTGVFHGYIYAPRSDFIVNAGLHVIGGLSANSVTVEPGAHLTFDKALETADLALAGIPTLVAWRMTDVPDRPITSRSTTPEKYLADGGVTPVEASGADADTYMEIKYYDSNGDPQIYSGLESGFNWLNVEDVAALVWDDDPVLGDEGRVVSSPLPLTKRQRRVRATSGKNIDG